MKKTYKLYALSFCTALALHASGTKEEIDSHKKIVGYFPEWGVYSAHNNYAPSDTPFDKLTHINYAFARIISGEIAIFDDWAATGIAFGEAWDSEYKGNLGQFKKLKQQYPDTNILISVGGWTQSANFHDVAASEASRLKFAKSCVRFIRQWDFDGVDIDWEFPTQVRQPDPTDNAGDTGTPNADISEKTTFTLLLKTLREELTRAGEVDGRYYQLTAAVGASQTMINNVETDKYHQYLDFVNIMTYDMHGAWENKTNHQSPLYSNPNIEDPDKLTIDNAVKLMKEAGVPKSKIIIGSPYYSRGWKGVQNDGNMADLPGLNATASGGAKGIWDGGRAAGVNPYYHIKATMEKDSSFVKYRDSYTKMPYLYSESKGEMYTYEDEESIAVKADYVNDNALGGVIFWEVSADYPSKGSTLTTVLFDNLLASVHPKYAHDSEVVEDESSDPEEDNDVVEDESSDPEEDNEVVEDNSNDPEEDNEVVEDNSNISNWNAREVYFANSMVYYNEKVYKSAWWSMGNEPGTEQWGPWKEQRDTEIVVPDESEEEIDNSDSTVDAYDSDKVYNLGDQVLYNGTIYEAAWWTKSDIPGSQVWGPWKKVATDTTTPEILNINPTINLFVPIDKQRYYQDELSQILIEFRATDSDGDIRLTSVNIDSQKYTMTHIGDDIYRIKWTPTSFGSYTLILEASDNDLASVSQSIEIEVIKK